MKHTKHKAFTLVEMLLVVAIIGIIAAGAIFTSQGFRNQVVFSSNFQNIEGVISEARNRSLTGESYEDTNDFDGDDSFDDFILPNGYIVNFKTVDDITTVSLWADLFDSTVGELDGSDFFLKSYELDKTIRVDTFAKRKTLGIVAVDNTDFSIIYTTPDANFELVGEPNASLQVKVYQINNDDEEIRARYIFMHYLFGIPEVLNKAYLT